MKDSTKLAIAPLEILAVGGDGIVVAAQGGILYVSGEELGVKRVCGAAITIADRLLVAAITLEKEVVILSKQCASDPWQEIVKHLLPKRPTAVAFSVSSLDVIVADGFGDVYKLPLDSSCNIRTCGDHAGVLLLGHFSTVTSLSLSSSMIATADRDNKLRVSRYPDTFVIQTFCLAHEEFITCVRFVGTDRVISGAGDGTLRLWSATGGQLLETVHIPDYASGNSGDGDVKECPVVTCIEICPYNSDIAVVGVYKAPYVLVVTGLLSSKRRILPSFLCDRNSITGMGFDEKCKLWVSLSSDTKSVRSYSIAGLNTGQPRLESEGILHFCRSETTQSCEASADEHVSGVSVTRFEWLNQQRKREMVDDWKGKKRKHIEI